MRLFKLTEFLDDVYKLHMCTTEHEYDIALLEFSQKYGGSHELAYFKPQWLVASFNRWQVFRNIPGYANTNSNIESFNATFKRDITEGLKNSVSVTLVKMKECVVFYSTKKVKSFAVMPKFDDKLKELAAEFGSKSFKTTIRSKCRDEECRMVECRDEEATFVIRLDNPDCFRGCSCNCFRFNKWAVCVLVLAYSRAFKLDLYGAQYIQPINFVK